MSATDMKLPVTGGAEKRSYVRGMFAAIAPSYDLLNHVLSLNADRGWRPVHQSSADKRIYLSDT